MLWSTDTDQAIPPLIIAVESNAINLKQFESGSLNTVANLLVQLLI